VDADSNFSTRIFVNKQRRFKYGLSSESSVTTCTMNAKKNGKESDEEMNCARWQETKTVAQHHLKSRSMLSTSCITSATLFSIIARVTAALREADCEDDLRAPTHGATVTLHDRVQRSCFCDDFRTT
jgi:hypothetical protein